jgi:hypothetical protein
LRSGIPVHSLRLHGAYTVPTWRLHGAYTAHSLCLHGAYAHQELIFGTVGLESLLRV